MRGGLCLGMFRIPHRKVYHFSALPAHKVLVFGRNGIEVNDTISDIEGPDLSRLLKQQEVPVHRSQ